MRGLPTMEVNLGQQLAQKDEERAEVQTVKDNKKK